MQALPEAQGRLVDNIVHFVRALRQSGLSVGTSQVKGAVSAVAVAGFIRRDDFCRALRATLVSRPEQLEVCHQVFRIFWRDPEILERMVRSMLPLLRTVAQDRGEPAAAQLRAAQALWDTESASGEPP